MEIVVLTDERFFLALASCVIVSLGIFRECPAARNSERYVCTQKFSSVHSAVAFRDKHVLTYLAFAFIESCSIIISSFFERSLTWPLKCFARMSAP